MCRSWEYYGNALGIFWEYYGDAMLMLCNSMGIPWKCYGNTMESHRAKSFGKRVEILWECFRSTVGAAWDTVDQNIIERSLESGGNIMGIPWEMLWEYYGNTVRMLCASFGNTPGMLWEYSRCFFRCAFLEVFLMVLGGALESVLGCKSCSEPPFLGSGSGSENSYGKSAIWGALRAAKVVILLKGSPKIDVGPFFPKHVFGATLGGVLGVIFRAYRVFQGSRKGSMCGVVF